MHLIYNVLGDNSISAALGLAFAQERFWRLPFQIFIYMILYNKYTNI